MKIDEKVLKHILICVSVVAFIMSIHSYFQVKELKMDLMTEKERVTELQGDIEYLQNFMTSDNLSYAIKTCDDFDEYLRLLRDSTGYTALIAVKDIQGNCINKNETDILKNMGFDQADVLLEPKYHAFIGVVKDGKMLYQHVGGDEAITYETRVCAKDVRIESATLNVGDRAVIKVDGVDNSVNGRGYNIVVIENKSGKIVDSVVFDAFLEDKPCYR